MTEGMIRTRGHDVLGMFRGWRAFQALSETSCSLMIRCRCHCMRSSLFAQAVPTHLFTFCVTTCWQKSLQLILPCKDNWRLRVTACCPLLKKQSCSTGLFAPQSRLLDAVRQVGRVLRKAESSQSVLDALGDLLPCTQPSQLMCRSALPAQPKARV